MLTLFTTAKPFKGHFAVIQRNALKSWTLLRPDVEIIVFGDDGGSAEVCREFGLRHEPEVARTGYGAIRLDDMFQRAQAFARHDLLCYANCDIIFQDDFCRALELTTEAHREFLMVGRRWDVDITEPIDFSRPNWQEVTLHRAKQANHQRDDGWIDYFAFTRGLYGADLPPLAIGRVCWDVWLVWKGLAQNKAVVDASRVVMAIHQNHDYNHHPLGSKGVWGGEEPKRNYKLSGGPKHFRRISDATHVITSEGMQLSGHRRWAAFTRNADMLRRFFLYNVWHPVWFAALDATRPLRTLLGLRSEATRRSQEKA